jgi:hypothetical protein
MRHAALAAPLRFALAESERRNWPAVGVFARIDGGAPALREGAARARAWPTVTYGYHRRETDRA